MRQGERKRREEMMPIDREEFFRSFTCRLLFAIIARSVYQTERPFSNLSPGPKNRVHFNVRQIPTQPAQPAPRLSPKIPVSTRSPRAPIQERRGTRRRDRSRGRAWRAKSPRSWKLRMACCFETAMEVTKAPCAGARLAGCRFSRISPRTRSSSASNTRWPVRSTSPALRRGCRRRGWHRPPGLPSASAIFNRPSKIRTFCIRGSSAATRRNAKRGDQSDGNPRCRPELNYNSSLVRSPSGLPQLCQIVATSYAG
jgi:hypothetical protein